MSVEATGPLTLPDLSQRSEVLSPFRYAILSECFATATGDAFLDWLETEAPWRRTQTDFYDQHEFSCWDCTSEVARFLTGPAVLSVVVSAMSQIFDCEFGEAVDVVFHRLGTGQRIGIHNDYLAGEETHRLVIQLNRGLKDADGGVLILFNSDDASDIHRMLRPRHRSGFAFEICEESHHAVSEVHGGERYTLIYSLRAVA